MKKSARYLILSFAVILLSGSIAGAETMEGSDPNYTPEYSYGHGIKQTTTDRNADSLNKDEATRLDNLTKVVYETKVKTKEVETIVPNPKE